MTIGTNNEYVNQIEAFKALVDEVNKIPGIHIDLRSEVDYQRDALAFAVDACYRQFKDSNWQLALKDLPLKVRAWNTPPDATKGSIAVLQLINNFYEYRILQILNDATISAQGRENAKMVYHLYQATIASILSNPPQGKPVSLAGISPSFLPEWYKQKLYLTNPL